MRLIILREQAQKYRKLTVVIMKINTFKDNCYKFETFDVYKVIQKERSKGVTVNRLFTQILIINH